MSPTPGNLPPNCDGAFASPGEITETTHGLVAVTISGVTDADGDVVGMVVTGISQDEPLHCDDGSGLCPDGEGVGTASAQVRAERDELGDGRVYHVAFRATDGRGGACTGVVVVCVPLAPGLGCADQGAVADAFCPGCLGLCEDWGSCLADACEQPTTPLDTPTARFGSMRCAFGVDIGDTCAAKIPRMVEGQFRRAQARIERAAAVRNANKARRLVRRALINLGRASKRLERAAEQKKIEESCVPDLRLLFERAQMRTHRWLGTL